MSTTIVEVASPAVAPVTRREVLHRAADLIGEWGLGYGSCAFPFDPDASPNPAYDGPLCILGAVAQAHRDLMGTAIVTYHDAAIYLGGDDACAEDYWRWNDESDRTAPEVSARLRKAAEAAA